MNNFDLHEKAQLLADTEASYSLARKLVEATRLLDYSDRYQDTNFEYRSSPFCDEVRTWLKVNLKSVLPDADYAGFEEK